mgnify:CR=1 FL=1
MDIRKYQLNILCLLLFPLSAAGQEWSKQDSLRLQQMLESDQEIKINRKLIEKVEQKMYSRKPFIHTYKMFQKPGSTFLPTYSWLRINKNLILHSKSDFAENSNHFHIQSQMEYKLSSRWSLDIYGSQNLDTRRYRGLPSEVEPTKLGSNVVFKINKNWKIKTGMQYQYNAIRKRWEWIPQVSVSYEW